MSEIWKPVVGYEGYYEVSNYGRVKRLETEVATNHKGTRTVPEHILNPIKTWDGYFTVHLSVDGKSNKKKVHRLVLEAFVPNPLNLPYVNHKHEFDKTDNFVWVNPDGSVDLEKSSIEWCDADYNNNYGTHQERGLKTRYEKYYQYSKAEEKRKTGKRGHYNPLVAYYKGEFFNRYDNPLKAEKDLLQYGVNKNAIYYVLRFGLDKEYNGFTFKKEDCYD